MALTQIQPSAELFIIRNFATVEPLTMFKNKIFMRLNSAYICVKDMSRVINFYEQFLGQQVTARDEIFSVFNFHGFRLCLFNNAKVNEEVKYGDNCLLSFEVEDARKLRDKMKKEGVEIVYPLKKLGKNLVFEFRDTEGNDIEVYSRINETPSQNIR